MRFTKIIFTLLVTVSVLLSSSRLLASAFDELSDHDQHKLKAGQQVSLYTNMQSPYAAWPQGTIYQRIDSTPEEAVAVFFDFKHHSEYLPQVLKSEISSFIDKTTFQVDYAVGIPYVPFGLAQETYALEYHLEFDPTDKSYSIAWHLIRPGTFTEYSQGSIRFETMENGGTLMAYDSFVLPYSIYYPAAGNSLAIEASKLVLKTVVGRIVGQIKKELTMESARLRLQVKAMRKVLGQ